MKQFLSGLTILAVLAAVGCSGGSSKPKNPTEPVTPATWSISALAVSDSDPFVGSVILITATATKDGSNAPDGTTVEIVVSGPTDDAVYGLGSVGNYVHRLATSSGQVATSLVAQTPGNYVIQATVSTASRQVFVEYIERDQSDILQIVAPLMPDQGAFEGGEQVRINAKGLVAPVEVDFIVDGTTHPAVVESVEESDPLSATGYAMIRTPHVTHVDRTVSHKATLVLRGGVDNSDEQQAQLAEAFTYLSEPEFLIYQPVAPNSGSFEGGELITLTGRAIEAPARVLFTVGSDTFEGITQSVTESVPASGAGTIVVETPYVPPALRPVDADNQPIAVTIDLTVTVAADTEDAQTAVVPSAFTFLPPDVPPNPIWRLLAPNFYLALPDYGASSGGETITLLGRNFRAQLIDTDGVTVLDTAPAVEYVKFGEIEGVVQSVSADGTQVQVMTPRYSTTPLADDESVTVAIHTYHAPSNGGDVLGNNEFDVSRANAFIFLADEPTPVITALAPIAGPIDGGTEVTIFGSGFQAPAQVTFGTLEATNVEVNDDQSLADQDTIICVTPDYSQQGATPPLGVNVTVKNILSGKISNAATFSYGDTLFITGNTPVEGGPGTQVIIYGSGFEDPLLVDFVPGTAGAVQKLGLDSIRLEVITVSGTELLVRFPVDAPVSCDDIDGSFLMTDVESQATAAGGTFTYLGSNPYIYGVEPIFVQEGDDGDSVSPALITINGAFFNPDLFVEFNNYRILSQYVNVLDTQMIEVTQIPPPNEFGLVWDTSTCVPENVPAGIFGSRNVPTAVDLTVTNLPGECSDTLIGGIVYEPEDTTCQVGVVAEPTFMTGGSVEAGSACSVVPFTLTNYSSEELQWNITVGNTYFTVDTLFGTLAAGVSVANAVNFCPPADAPPGPVSATMTVTSFGDTVNYSQVVELFGIVEAARMDVAPLSLPFGTQTAATTLTVSISNSGNIALNWAADQSDDPDNVFDMATFAGTVPPGGSVDYDVVFTPGGVPPTGHTGSITFSATGTTAAIPDVVVDLSGTDG